MTYFDWTLLETIAIIVMIFSFAGLSLGALFAFLKWQFESEGYGKYLCIAIVSGVLLFSSLWGGATANSNANECLTNHIAAGYSVYYNGEKTDGTKLDISKYSVTINEEKEEIYLSDKPARSHRTYIPVVIPR